MITILNFSLNKVIVQEELHLYMDLRIKEVIYESPKKGIFHDGPIGKVNFDSVQMSSGDIDIID